MHCASNDPFLHFRFRVSGCALIELFTETPPFNLQTLLAYRAEESESFPERILSRVGDEDIQVFHDFLKGMP